MKSGKSASAAPVTTDTEDIFHMANLSPRMTGLPMSVWVSPRGNASHDVRINVNVTHGNHMTLDNAAVVALRPRPHLVAGRLSTEDQRAVFAWITLNSTTIIAYWEGRTDTSELI